MKSIVSDTPCTKARPYPKLIRSAQSAGIPAYSEGVYAATQGPRLEAVAIMLMLSTSEGMVVSSATTSNPVGYYSKTFKNL